MVCKDPPVDALHARLESGLFCVEDFNPFLELCSPPRCAATPREASRAVAIEDTAGALTPAQTSTSVLLATANVQCVM